MSGGHWNYDQYRILDLISNLTFNLANLNEEDEEYKDIELELLLKKIPLLNNVAIEIGRWFFDYIHDLDYHLEGDTIIDCPKDYEDDMIIRLKKIIKDIENGK